MGYISVYVHLVWTTKNREPLLTKEIRQVVFCHILENARAKGIFVDFIGGYLEHVHCLISLGNDQPISKIIQLIKEEYNPIRKIFTGDNQIMAEVYIIEGKELIIKNAYICEIPKEHSGEHAEILIKSFK